MAFSFFGSAAQPSGSKLPRHGFCVGSGIEVRREAKEVCKLCGEGIYPRWGAKQPPSQAPRCVRKIAFSSLGLLRSPAGINPLATEACRGPCDISGHRFMWRGSLLPLGCEAAPKPVTSVCQENCLQLFGSAAQPSGSKLPRHGLVGSGIEVRREAKEICKRCGEGIYRNVAPPRRGAKQPSSQSSRCVRGIAFSSLGLLRSPAGINPLATERVWKALAIFLGTASCGEGACSRWGAKQPPSQSPRCVRNCLQPFGSAAQPSGSKLPRHGFCVGSGIEARWEANEVCKPCGEGIYPRWGAKQP